MFSAFLRITPKFPRDSASYPRDSANYPRDSANYPRDLPRRTITLLIRASFDNFTHGLSELFGRVVRGSFAEICGDLRKAPDKSDISENPQNMRKPDFRRVTFPTVDGIS